MEIRNSVIVITGASQGLGRALALLAVAQGARVIGNARTEKELEEVCQQTGMIPVAGDVASQSTGGRLAAAALERFGRIDIWINNAGIWLPHQPIEHIPLDRHRQQMDVNYFGVLHGSLAAYQTMRQQRSGVIVNILSMRVKANLPGTSAYVASKGAAWMLTNTLRLEAAAHGIQVVGVFPARMKTHLFDEQRPPEYATYMDPALVAGVIIQNIQRDPPEAEQFILKV